MKKFALIFCLLFLCFGFVFAQSRRPAGDGGGKSNQRPTATPSPSPSEDDSIDETVEVDNEVLKISTDIVTIPVKVLDRKGKFVGGLTRESFKIYENNVEQEVAYFSNEQAAFTVALVLDVSYSAKFKIGEIQSAAISFITQLSPKDRVTVIAFDGETRVLCEPTNDRKQLVTAIKSTKIETGTSVYDTIDLILLQKLNRIGGRKAIVLFTDGVDTTSIKANITSNKTAAAESDVLIYVVQYDTYAEVQAVINNPVLVQQPTQVPGKQPNPIPMIGVPGGKGTTREEYDAADQYLIELATGTGGEVLKANEIVDISTAFTKIAASLREYYSIGFYPKEESKNGKRHKLKVKVDRENVAVKARDSYTTKKAEK